MPDPNPAYLEPWQTAWYQYKYIFVFMFFYIYSLLSLLHLKGLSVRAHFTLKQTTWDLQDGCGNSVCYPRYCVLLVNPAHPSVPCSLAFCTPPIAVLLNCNTPKITQLFHIPVACWMKMWAEPSENVFEHVQNALIQIHPTHAQNLIRAFSLNWYILKCAMNLLVDSEGPDQTAQMGRLIWVFTVHICPKTRFCMARTIY